MPSYWRLGLHHMSFRLRVYPEPYNASGCYVSSCLLNWHIIFSSFVPITQLVKQTGPVILQNVTLLHMLSYFLKVPRWLTSTRSGAPRYSDLRCLMHALSEWQPILRVQLAMPLCILQTVPRVQWEHVGCGLIQPPTGFCHHPRAIFATKNGWEPETTGQTFSKISTDQVVTLCWLCLTFLP